MPQLPRAIRGVPAAHSSTSTATGCRAMRRNRSTCAVHALDRGGLGVRPSNAYSYVLIASPAGSYFPAVSSGHRVAVGRVREPHGWHRERSSPATTRPRSSRSAGTAEGCDQVVWLDAVSTVGSRRWAMNCARLRLRASARIVTPALTGTLLPGITRDSLLTLATTSATHRGGQDLYRRLAARQRLR